MCDFGPLLLIFGRALSTSNEIVTFAKFGSSQVNGTVLGVGRKAWPSKSLSDGYSYCEMLLQNSQEPARVIIHSPSSLLSETEITIA